MNPTFQRLLRDAARLTQGASAKTLAPGLSALSAASPTSLPPAFQTLMADAARLTQGGNLQAATAAIQAALSGATASPATSFFDDANVIDVDAQVVPPVGSGPAQDAPTASPTSSTPPTRPGAGGQFISGNHAAAGSSREYKLFIPPASFDGPLPLVVMLHGCTQNPDDFAVGTGMNDVALQRGFYVLYPAQTQHANASRCWNWFKHTHQKRGQGEPALLTSMTRHVMAQYPIDPQRVYVAGLSAGGAMAAILGDTYPDVFAAVGVHSGLPTGAATNLQAALSVMKTGAAPARRGVASPPTIVFHGDGDTTVSPANGEQVLTASAGALKGDARRARSPNGRDYTQRTYRDTQGHVVAEHWAVHGAGHAWSGGHSQGSYTDPTGPDATQEMLRFFLTHPLRKTH